MSTYDDLSPYEYAHEWLVFDHSSRSYDRHPIPGRTRNVGWLDVRRPFPSATPDTNFLAALVAARRFVCQQTRGFHRCELHPDRLPIRYRVGVDGLLYDAALSSDGELLTLGSNELWVPDGHAGYFAAPSLIIHYVHEHSYAPPQEFVDAVLLAFGDASVLPSD